MKALAKLAARSFGYDIVQYRDWIEDRSVLRPEFRTVEFASQALQKLIDDCDFTTVLDIGSGAGEHTEAFLRHGKKVTALDYGRGRFFERNTVECLIGDFNAMTFDRQFDCVWASHVLEHQLNPGTFQRKIFEVTKEGGVICITVPPYQPEILAEHVSFWNAGLLLYHLVFAGFDCREASIKAYGYNISVILRKRSVVPVRQPYEEWPTDLLPDCMSKPLSNGNILEWNWS